MSAFNEITLLREADTHNLKRILYELAGTKYSFNLRKLYCAPKKLVKRLLLVHSGFVAVSFL